MAKFITIEAYDVFKNVLEDRIININQIVELVDLKMGTGNFTGIVFSNNSVINVKKTPQELVKEFSKK